MSALLKNLIGFIKGLNVKRVQKELSKIKGKNENDKKRQEKG